MGKFHIKIGLGLLLFFAGLTLVTIIGEVTSVYDRPSGPLHAAPAAPRVHG